MITPFFQSFPFPHSRNPPYVRRSFAAVRTGQSPFTIIYFIPFRGKFQPTPLRCPSTRGKRHSTRIHPHSTCLFPGCRGRRGPYDQTFRLSDDARSSRYRRFSGRYGLRSPFATIRFSAFPIDVSRLLRKPLVSGQIFFFPFQGIPFPSIRRPSLARPDFAVFICFYPAFVRFRSPFSLPEALFVTLDSFKAIFPNRALPLLICDDNVAVTTSRRQRISARVFLPHTTEPLSAAPFLHLFNSSFSPIIFPDFFLRQSVPLNSALYPDFLIR